MAKFDRSKWVRSTPLTENDRKAILDVGNLGPPTQEFQDRLKPDEDPIELRKLVVLEQVHDCDHHVELVYDVLSADGGAPYCAAHPALPHAVLHDVYQRAGDVKVDDETVSKHAREVFEDVAPALYEEKIRGLFNDVGVTVTLAELQAIRERMQREGVEYDSPRFKESAFGMTSGALDHGYAKFFDAVPTEAKPVSQELPGLRRGRRRRRAIEVLRSLGVDPEYADDDDWGRIAAAMARFGPGGEALSGAPLDFPEFDTAEDLGLDPEAIATVADLYYIHAFDRAGAFDAVDHLAARFVDDTELELGAAAPLLFLYIKRAADRLPAEDRRKITKRLFEGEPDTDTCFEVLMVRLSEAMTAFSNARTAGELLCNDGDRLPLSARRLTVHRAIEDLQRELSRNGGGIAPFLAQEAGTQLMDSFQILQSEALRCAIGEDAGTDIFSVISRLNDDAGNDGSCPPTDHLRTLGVEGRRIIQYLAKDAATAGELSDDDLDELSVIVSAWYAAYRWPDGGKDSDARGRDEAAARSADNGSRSVIQLR